MHQYISTRLTPLNIPHYTLKPKAMHYIQKIKELKKIKDFQLRQIYKNIYIFVHEYIIHQKHHNNITNVKHTSQIATVLALLL